MLLSARSHLSTCPRIPVPVCPSLGVCSPLVAASLEPTEQCSLDNPALHLEAHFKAFKVCTSFPLGSSRLGIYSKKRIKAVYHMLAVVLFVSVFKLLRDLLLVKCKEFKRKCSFTNLFILGSNTLKYLSFELYYDRDGRINL